MKNESDWRPSKYVFRRGKLRASRNPSEVSVSSRLVVDLVANSYERHLPLHAKGDLLDLGCGKIPLYIAYRKLVSSATCVDWANTLHPNPHLDLECDINDPLMFPDASFDTVILSDVLEHIRSPQDLLCEIRRVLRPDGVLLMNVPFLYWLHEEPHDYFRYTRHALQLLCKTSGLRVLHLEAIGGAPEALADICPKNAKVLPIIGKPFAAALQAITFFIHQTKTGGEISARSGLRFPLGYFLIANTRSAGAVV
jgi:SAM-dependent methyltransferase